MGQESSRDTSAGTLLPKSWPPSWWAGCPEPGEDRRTSQLRLWLSHDRLSPGAAGGTLRLEEPFRFVLPRITNVLRFLTGNSAEHLAGRECRTYVKGGAVLREVGRIVVSLETTFTFPYQYSTKLQRGTIRGSSASAPCRR